MRQFRSALINLPRPSGFLHVLVDDDSQPTQSFTRLPRTPRSAREKVIVSMKAMGHPLSLQQIAELGMNFINSISLSTEAKGIVEQHTRPQAASKRWHEEHFARITASKFGEIVKSRTKLTLCSRLLYPDTSKSLDSSAAIQWGRDNEAVALKQYSEQLYDELYVSESGIHISEYGFLGASPDGLVCRVQDNSIAGIVEVKCPYSARNCTVEEACHSKPNFFCLYDSVEECVHLKKTHNYFYQVQGQMGVLNARWCEFIVWTPSSFTVETITFDSGLWERALKSLVSFYITIMLPEIVYPRFPNIPYDYSSTSLITFFL